MVSPSVDRDALIELAMQRVRDRHANSGKKVKLAWTPSPLQQSFIDLTCMDALYGGAAGGGKSITLLMDAAENAHESGYSALLLRKTFNDLNKPGALIPRSFELYGRTGARYNHQDHRWTFPSGATISFGYLDHEDDIYQYQGSEFQYIGFDELTQFSPEQHAYLFSRLRRPVSLMHIPLKMRAASNPGGKGASWVYNHYINPPRPDPDVVFVPAKLRDNPYLDQESYIKSLMALGSPTLIAQLLDGDWDVRDGVAFPEFRRERHVVPTDYDRIRNWRRIAAHDWGYDSPGAHLWFAIDPEGGAIAYREYSFHQLHPDEIAIVIKYRQSDEQITTTYADPSCWKTGSSQAALTTDMIAKLSESSKLDLTVGKQYKEAGLDMQPANNARIPGKLRLHTLFAPRPADGIPYLRFMDCCEDAITTFQGLQMNPDKPEDVVDKYPPSYKVWQRDEYYDVTRYASMGIPLKALGVPGTARRPSVWNI